MIETSEVKLHFLDYWRVVRVRLGLIMLVFLLVVVTAGVTVYFLPKQYEAIVTMEVQPDNYKAIDMFGGSMSRTYDPQFVTTQFQILRKAEILYPVIEQLGLAKIYSGDGPVRPRQEILMLLNQSLDLREVRNTGLIEIGVYNQDQELAATIANTIAVTLSGNAAWRTSIGSQQRRSPSLRRRSEKQREVVEKAGGAAAQIRAAKRDHRPGSGERLDYRNVERASGSQASEQAVNEQRTMIAQLRTELELHRTLKPDELMEVLRTLNIEDQTVMKNMPLLQDSSAERSSAAPIRARRESSADSGDAGHE